MRKYHCTLGVIGVDTVNLKNNSVSHSLWPLRSCLSLYHMCPLLHQQGWNLKVPSSHCFICWPHALTRSEPFERLSTARTYPTSWIWLPPSLSLQWSSISRCVQTHRGELWWSTFNFWNVLVCTPPPTPQGWCTSLYSNEVVGWHLKGASFHGSWICVLHWVMETCLK